VQVLREAGARFVYLHGSQAAGTARPDSDVDLAAWFGRPVDAWAVALPPGVDLLVLDCPPLELTGRVAQYGRLLLDLDPAARVAWEDDVQDLPRRAAPDAAGAAGLRRGAPAWLTPSGCTGSCARRGDGKARR
jgi:hypothetical protein